MINRTAAEQKEVSYKVRIAQDTAVKCVTKWVLCLLLSLSMVLGGQAFAQSKSTTTTRGINSGQAANIARSATGGKVLSVIATAKAYKIKVLKENGVVTSVHVDKISGKVRR